MKKIFCILIIFTVLFTSLNCTGKGNNSTTRSVVPTHSTHGYKSDCVFCDIARGTGDATVYYTDGSIIAFRDINPQPNVHTLVIPKGHIENLADVSTGDKRLLGHMLVEIAKIGTQQCPDGFRVVANTGKGAHQTVFHLHFHILGGRDIGVFPGRLGTDFAFVETDTPIFQNADIRAYMCATSKYRPHIIIKLVKPISSLALVGDGDEHILGKILLKISEFGHDRFNNNFRVIINSGKYAHQEDPSNIYIHIIGTEGTAIPTFAFSEPH